MAKYIDADKLAIDLQHRCDVICPYTKAQRDVMCRACLLGDAIDTVEDQPAVEISDIITSDNEYMGSVVQGRWIPVTERLPKLNRDVLLSVRQSYAFGESDNWCVVGGLIDKADITWATRYGFHDLLYSNGKKHTVWVSAWMPLPEPYKGSEEE